MKTMEMIRALGIALTCIAVATAVTSCGKGSTPSSPGSNDKGETAEAQTVTIEAPKEPTMQERYEAEFKRLVVRTRRTPGEKSAEIRASNICVEISKMPTEEALPLLDKLLDMAIAQPVTDTDYHLREVWFERLFHVVESAFIVSQRMRKESFEHWDKLFMFFKRYADEITKVRRKHAASSTGQYRN